MCVHVLASACQLSKLESGVERLKQTHTWYNIHILYTDPLSYSVGSIDCSLGVVSCTNHCPTSCHTSITNYPFLTSKRLQTRLTLKFASLKHLKQMKMLPHFQLVWKVATQIQIVHKTYLKWIEWKVHRYILNYLTAALQLA